MKHREGDRTVYSTRLFEVLEFDAPAALQPCPPFERVRRSPGVRVLLSSVDGGLFLLSLERRFELQRTDLRLPGGKLFDDVRGGASFWLAPEAVQVEFAEAAARKELAEELGVTPVSLTLIDVVTGGSTIEWDLYYFVTKGWTALPEGPTPERGEESIQHALLSAADLWQAAHDGQIAEASSAHVISKYLYPQFGRSRKA